jgi:thiol-disulfide isomerase/thioredoxin
MPRKSILPVCFAAILAMTNGAAAEPRNAGQTIIFFGASWCAPCRIELRNLPALAKAAAPNRLEIAWIDRAPPASARMAGSNVAVLSPQEALRKFEMIAGDNRGLPVVAMIDGNRRICAILRQPATVARLRSLDGSCSR